jgi:transcriptional regulator with XRE-family HTH domain
MAIGEMERQYNEEVGRRIRAARKEAGVSLKALAPQVGVSDVQLSCYECGYYRCPPMMLDALAQKFRVPLRQLVPRLNIVEIAPRRG